MATVSVIIPCYNQGHFLDDAVESVLGSSYRDFEIIVVNDGSTDDFTNTLLKNYNREKVQVLSTSNQGLAAARNRGIEKATGKYILPLDADDKIGPDYLQAGADTLERDDQTGIVYCRAELFGAVVTEWALPRFSLERMLLDNIIFCSALFRKDDWLRVGGYDPGMIYGWEDYDFWLSLLERGRKVVRLDMVGFFYRVASDSMVRSVEKHQKVAMFKRIYARHPTLFADNIGVWIEAVLHATDNYYTSRLYLDCGQGISDESSIPRKVEAGTRRIVFDLRKFTSIKGLRLDPVDTWAVLRVEKLALKNSSGQTHFLDNLDSNALYKNGDILLFDTSDPQCYFPPFEDNRFKNLTEVSLQLQFLALGSEALQYIVTFQKELLGGEKSSVTETLRNMRKSLPFKRNLAKKKPC